MAQNSQPRPSAVRDILKKPCTQFTDISSLLFTTDSITVDFYHTKFNIISFCTQGSRGHNITFRHKISLNKCPTVNFTLINPWSYKSFTSYSKLCLTIYRYCNWCKQFWQRHLTLSYAKVVRLGSSIYARPTFSQCRISVHNLSDHGT